MSHGRSDPAPLAGRRGERRWIDDALAKVGAGNPRLLVVAGEAGVGKSRLVADTIERHHDDWLIGVGYCLEEGQRDLPYAPLTGILAAVARSDQGGELLADVAADWPSLMPLVGATSSDALDDTTSGLSQLRLLDTLGKLFGELAHLRPTLLVIEDAHWADAATRAFVSFLARNVVAVPLAVLLTVRTDELHRQHPLRPLLAELARLPTVTRLDVEPLGTDDLAEMLARLAGAPLPLNVVRSIAERSGGNPFFAEQLLAVGGDQPDGVGRLPAGGLTDLLLQRVDRLGPGARRLLSVASLAGRRVDHDVLVTVAAMPDADFTAAVREAADNRLFGVDDGGTGYVFHHALLAEAIAADLLPGERGALHGRYAAALAGRAAPAVIARHLFGAGDRSSAFAASAAAAELAAGVSAFDAALAHWNAVLDLWDDGAVAEREALGGRGAVSLRAARAAAGAGDVNQARRHARTAVEAAAGQHERAEARLVLAELLSPAATGAGAASIDEATAARAEAGDDAALAARATAALARAHYLARQFDAAVTPADEAAAAAARIGLDAVALAARATAHLCRRERGDRDGDDGDAATTAELVAAAQATPDVDTGLWVLTRLAELSFRADLAEGERLALDAYDFAVRHGVRSSVQGVWVRETLALCRLLNGNWDAVQELARADPLPINDLTSGTVSIEAQVDIHRGFLQRSRQRLELAQRVAPDALSQAFIGIAWISQYLAEDDPVAAVGVCVDRLAQLPRSDSHLAIETSLVARGMGALATAHELGLVAPGGDELLAWADRLVADADAAAVPWRTSSPLSLLMAHRSRLTRSDPALWRAAADQRGERPYDGGVCRYYLGAALLQDGDVTAAATALRMAAATFRGLGAAVMLDHVEALATRARIRLDSPAEPRTVAERWGLTERELQVLALVAEGHTNRQIGESLFISSRTAGVHVSNILAKLEVNTRGEAAALAQRVALLTT